MTAPELPEDPAKWPRDPYQLLGVDAGVDERGLKRAYAQLIRRFKPEHSPQQFVLIRAAYEQILERLNWLAEFTDRKGETQSEPGLKIQNESHGNPDPQSTDDVDRTGVPLGDESFSSEPSPETSSVSPISNPLEPNEPKSLGEPQPRTTRSRTDQIEAAWDLATRSDLTAGYQQLARFVPSERWDEVLFLRLYWIQRLKPAIEPERSSAYWLEEAIRSGCADERVWSLYAIELERHPHLAQTSVCDSLLNLGLELHRLFQFLECRWQAAAKVSSWELIEADLARIRNRVADRNLGLWFRLLFRVVDLAAWSIDAGAKRLIAETSRWLDEVNTIGQALQREYQRYDFLHQAIKELDPVKLQHFPVGLLQVLQFGWLEKEIQFRPRLMAYLENWIHQPREALKLIDELYLISPFAVSHLLSLVRKFDLDDDERLSGPNRPYMNQPVTNFLIPRIREAYGNIRTEIFEFCLQQHIHPIEFLDVFENELATEMWGGTFQLMKSDLVLETVLRGIFVFWD